MNFTAWVTLLRDGIPRRHDIRADDIDSARDAAEALARCIYPKQSVAIAVRQQ